MSQALPTGGCGWVGDCQSLGRTIAQYPVDNQERFILEVDLEYPEELHETHNTYPLAPERMVIQKEWMSGYQHNLMGVEGRPQRWKSWYQTSATRNAMCFSPAITSSICHLEYISQRFTGPFASTKARGWCPTSAWIQICGKKTSGDFEKDIYKLMNNSVFGKTIENLKFVSP